MQYREAEASLQTFDQLMQQPSEQRPEEPVDIGLLERLRFANVVFRYRDASENVIEHLSFTAELGDTIAFVEPSGSGKSTLVKLLVELYTLVSGVITIDNVPVNELRYNRVRWQIGFVTQEPQIFSGTIHENLLVEWALGWRRLLLRSATCEIDRNVLGQACVLQHPETRQQGILRVPRTPGTQPASYCASAATIQRHVSAPPHQDAVPRFLVTLFCYFVICGYWVGKCNCYAPWHLACR